MQTKTFANKEIYQVLIKAPIETVWSELIKTTSPRPFFWDSSWDAKSMAPFTPKSMSADKWPLDRK